MEMKKITIIVPVFNEEQNVSDFFREVSTVLMRLPVRYEILFVDDGSRDSTLSRIRALQRRDPHVSYLSLLDNYGKEAAMYAGFCHAEGDYIGVMDADLQDPPGLLGKMLEFLEKGDCDCVTAVRKDRRGENLLRSAGALVFYRSLSVISGKTFPPGIRDFRLMTEKAAGAVRRNKEHCRFFKGIASFRECRVKYVFYQNTRRNRGSSKWKLSSLFRYGLDGYMSMKKAPAGLPFLAGFLLMLAEGITCLFSYKKQGNSKTEQKKEGSLTGENLFRSVIFICQGIQLMLHGVQEQYLHRIYQEARKKPDYIISEDGRLSKT